MFSIVVGGLLQVQCQWWRLPLIHQFTSIPFPTSYEDEDESWPFKHKPRIDFILFILFSFFILPSVTFTDFTWIPLWVL